MFNGHSVRATTLCGAALFGIARARVAACSSQLASRAICAPDSDRAVRILRAAALHRVRQNLAIASVAFAGCSPAYGELATNLLTSEEREDAVVRGTSQCNAIHWSRSDLTSTDVKVCERHVANNKSKQISTTTATALMSRTDTTRGTNQHVIPLHSYILLHHYTTVDGQGRVWAGIVDFRAGHNRVFRSDQYPSLSFTEESPPLRGTNEPKLVTDPFGNVWFGGAEGHAVYLQRFSMSTGNWDVSSDYTAICGVDKVPLRDDVTIGSGQKIRNAHSYDFDVGKNEDGKLAVRFLFQATRDDGRRFLQGADFSTGGTCVAPLEMSTYYDSGQQFQPSLSYKERTLSTGEKFHAWWSVYLSTAAVPDPSKDFLHPEARRLFTGKIGEEFHYFYADREYLAPLDWYACARVESGYWGDCFGLTQFQTPSGWRAASVFSSSRPAPECGRSSDVLARPLHVAAQVW